MEGRVEGWRLPGKTNTFMGLYRLWAWVRSPKGLRPMLSCSPVCLLIWQIPTSFALNKGSPAMYHGVGLINLQYLQNQPDPLRAQQPRCFRLAILESRTPHWISGITVACFAFGSAAGSKHSTTQYQTQSGYGANCTQANRLLLVAGASSKHCATASWP